MQESNQKQLKIVEAIQNTYPQESSNQTLYTVAQFADKEPAFTEFALRNYIYKSEPRISIKGTIPGNGLVESGAIIRIGRRVLIDRVKFLTWIATQQKIEEQS